MTKVFHLLYSFSFIALVAGCSTIPNNLEGIVLENPAAPASGIMLIDVDSIATSTTQLEFWFTVNFDVIPDSSEINRLVIYRGNNPWKKLSPGNFSYFIDINVSPYTTYNYHFGLEANNGDETKLTDVYTVRTE